MPLPGGSVGALRRGVFDPQTEQICEISALRGAWGPGGGGVCGGVCGVCAACVGWF